MAANFSSADAVTRFLSATPDPSASGGGIERLVEPLKAAGGNGLSVPDLFAASGLARPDFLDALGRAVAGQIVEKYDGPGGMDWVRASKGALALF